MIYLYSKVTINVRRRNIAKETTRMRWRDEGKTNCC